MELLTDEEIVAAINGSRDGHFILVKMSEGFTSDVRAIAQAQLDKDIASNQQAYEIGVSDGKVEGEAIGIKLVVEFVEGNMPHPNQYTPANYARFWLSLQEKLKEWFDGKL